MTYDQHDRLVTVTDALGNTTTRYYDKRDNEIWLQDANGHWFGKGYDAMGRLTHEYSFFNASPASLAEAQAALVPGNALHDELIDVASTLRRVRQQDRSRPTPTAGARSSHTARSRRVTGAASRT